MGLFAAITALWIWIWASAAASESSKENKGGTNDSVEDRVFTIMLGCIIAPFALIGIIFIIWFVLGIIAGIIMGLGFGVYNLSLLVIKGISQFITWIKPISGNIIQKIKQKRQQQIENNIHNGNSSYDLTNFFKKKSKQPNDINNNNNDDNNDNNWFNFGKFFGQKSNKEENSWIAMDLESLPKYEEINCSSPQLNNSNSFK
ncbi:uncharacterized protein ASCRUDRAFT_69662 [Ascoidea rubescens DSM 1968]|uniref:Transmembrane protein n=1 Tax=Ascoidea rubescens DSM 1968 TaxID=1344418 RepID=A0A1D2VJZ5_9ASCO|nr:hypothetical protein ASCRUDRAFT_69662 [Ascoidea rubescens DSM 1968]ODV61951.1 hypothetical protein ASCRUDRAFT_69662 [Ascoidea rubescens DSM 1968]